MRFFILFFAVLLIFGCIKRDGDIYSIGNPNGAQVSDLIKITSVSKTSIEADNVTASVITIKIHPETDTLARLITVTTSVGTFQNGKTSDVVTADAYGIATVSLISPTPGITSFTAKIKSWSIDTTVTFIPALPDDMLLSADNLVVDANASIVMTDVLTRNPFRGSVSDPCKVSFVVTGTGSNALAYPAFSISADKKATATITNPTHIKGSFQVEAKTLSSIGDTLRKSIGIIIQ